MIRYRLLLLVLFSTAFAFTQAQSKKKLTYGETKDGVYTNKFFGLKLTFDKSWSVKSREELEALTNQGKELIKAKNEDLADLLDLSEAVSAYYLFISKYETGAPVEYNPSLIVLSENLKLNPGIKTGTDYLYQAKKLLVQTKLNYTFPDDGTERVNGFNVMTAELTYLGSTITQLYFCRVIDGYALCCIASYKNEEEKKELLSFINTATIE